MSRTLARRKYLATCLAEARSMASRPRAPCPLFVPFSQTPSAHTLNYERIEPPTTQKTTDSCFRDAAFVGMLPFSLATALPGRHEPTSSHQRSPAMALPPQSGFPLGPCSEGTSNKVLHHGRIGRGRPMKGPPHHEQAGRSAMRRVPDTATSTTGWQAQATERCCLQVRRCHSTQLSIAKRNPCITTLAMRTTAPFAVLRVSLHVPSGRAPLEDGHEMCVKPLQTELRARASSRKV